MARLRETFQKVAPTEEDTERAREHVEQLAATIALLDGQEAGRLGGDGSFYALVVLQMELMTALAREVVDLRNEIAQMQERGH